MKKKFYKEFHNKSSSELEEIIHNEKSYQKEAVSLAKEILTSRKNNPEKKAEQSEKENNKFSPEKSRYEFKHSLEEKIWVVLSILFFLYFGIKGYLNASEYYFILLLLAFLIAFISRNIFSNKPEIVVDKRGIWTSSHGFTDWSKIERVILKDRGIMRYLTRFYLNDELEIYMKDNAKKRKIKFFIISGISNKNLLDKLIKHYMENNEK
ncbi:hypothetical protein Q4553_06430 [Tenacibaculum soleae]|uniref:hypothetical protein n=1 Tax=Tenacibaculum soleae TaxID=447689 RepID=UPI0026E4656D|nr:hypothetical protein [Tenacibaculum soleae]MDO6744204.1 hypothetical protein [Tenacibaculum soleae]